MRRAILGFLGGRTPSSNPSQDDGLRRLGEGEDTSTSSAVLSIAAPLLLMVAVGVAASRR